MIPERVARRAQWVLGTLGADGRTLGDDLPYDAQAWAQAERGELPTGDELAAAFFHLARVEERGGPRDRHGRFPAAASALDPLDPPVERLRERLGLEPPRPRGARFAVALTHDVDVPWRWTRVGIRGGAARVKREVAARRPEAALREARALVEMPLHKARGTDPNWRFDRIMEIEAERGTTSTFFVMAGHGHRADGPSPDAYARRRGRLVATLAAGGAEVALHGSYLAAEDATILAGEKAALEALAREVAGQRYHYLRVRPHENLRPLADLGFRYDATLGFADAVGFRGGIAHPFRPWDLARDQPLDLLEIPLALMDVTLAEDRYLGLSARAAERHVDALLDRAAEGGGAFAVLWHTDRFDRATARGWDRLYARLVDGVHDRGGICLSAGELADLYR